MIADLVILGLAVKIILGALSRRRQPGDADGAQPAHQTRR
jgi:voltage-gated potassium channel